MRRLLFAGYKLLSMCWEIQAAAVCCHYALRTPGRPSQPPSESPKPFLQATHASFFAARTLLRSKVGSVNGNFDGHDGRRTTLRTQSTTNRGPTYRSLPYATASPSKAQPDNPRNRTFRSCFEMGLTFGGSSSNACVNCLSTATNHQADPVEPVQAVLVSP